MFHHHQPTTRGLPHLPGPAELFSPSIRHAGGAGAAAYPSALPYFFGALRISGGLSLIRRGDGEVCRQTSGGTNTGPSIRSWAGPTS
ncbi:hypothetical protein MJ561_16865 [Klebsiella pneumoniae]|nr:hypothetical protein MJ561_16865 [Klebsiella pneumoniae]